jgi:hypothetical protein
MDIQRYERQGHVRCTLQQHHLQQKVLQHLHIRLHTNEDTEGGDESAEAFDSSISVRGICCIQFVA